jgi:gamma-glutamyltranspeptidase/glutathione hydrolase
VTLFDDRPTEASLTTGVRSSYEAVVVTPHHLASAAALEILESGGNAVDAAIAANAVQGVVAPDTCGIGGDLFALVHKPGDATPQALNASGRAGSGTTAAELRSDHNALPRRHAATITTPGCVDGWISLADVIGVLPLDMTLAPAIALAADGFPVSYELAASLVRLHEMIGSQGSSRPLYPQGEPASAGQTVMRPRLAETLAGIASGDRGSFYGGEVGSAIVAATDGILTLEDLERRNADWIDPIGIDVFGHRAWTTPPNTQGYLTLAAAWVFEQLETTRDPANPAFAHAVIEAYRSVAWERDNVVSDPDTAPLEPETLLDPDRLAPFLATVSTEMAGAFPQPRPAPGGTAYMCVRDGNGMGVSLIQSNFWGIGSGRSAGDTGVFLHNRGAGFNLIPGHPNEYEPGRRPLHTLSPTLWTQGNELSMILGTRGGQYQPQLLIQMATAMLHGGMSPAAAQHAPRWQVEGWQPGEESIVRVESRMDRGIADGLEALGHQVRRAAAWEPGWGPVSVITESNALILGAADPRVSTSAAL